MYSAISAPLQRYVIKPGEYECGPCAILQGCGGDGLRVAFRLCATRNKLHSLVFRASSHPWDAGRIRVVGARGDAVNKQVSNKSDYGVQ